MTTKTTQWPEHEKLQLIADKSQAIGEFVDWLQAHHGAIICHRPTVVEGCIHCSGRGHGRRYQTNNSRFFPEWQWLDTGVECDICAGTGEGDPVRMVELHPMTTPIRRLLAEFFEIDESRLGSEKRAMIESMR